MQRERDVRQPAVRPHAFVLHKLEVIEAPLRQLVVEASHVVPRAVADANDDDGQRDVGRGDDGIARRPDARHLAVGDHHQDVVLEGQRTSGCGTGEGAENIRMWYWMGREHQDVVLDGQRTPRCGTGGREHQDVVLEGQRTSGCGTGWAENTRMWYYRGGDIMMWYWKGENIRMWYWRGREHQDVVLERGQRTSGCSTGEGAENTRMWYWRGRTSGCGAGGAENSRM